MPERRKSVATERVSFRWGVDVAAIVCDLAARTGWSEAKAAAFLVRAGSCYLVSRKSCGDPLRAEAHAAVMVHAAAEKGRDLLKAARAKARVLAPKVAAPPDETGF